MRVSVYGCGLTGLVTAAALASTGHQVVALAAKGESLEALQAGRLPLAEPGLSELLNAQLQAQRLRFTAELRQGIDHGEVHCIALDADQQALAASLIEGLGAATTPDLLVVVQSAFKVGTVERFHDRLQALRPESLQATTAVVSLPDFLQEGAAVRNFTRPDRLLLGAESAWAVTQVRELLRPFNRNHDCLMVMPPREAEFTKFVINGMLATRLSFMNEMANVADQLGVDIERVRQGVGSDQRIGFDYLYPGCGFGGIHFSRHLDMLRETVRDAQAGSPLLDTVVAINEEQKEVLFRKLWRHYRTQLADKTVAVWGVSFKPNTANIDYAPSLRLLESLWAQGAKVRAFDPEALSNLRARFGERPDLVYAQSPYDAADGADALMVVTEWKPFWSPDFARLKQLLKQPVILDGRNIYDPAYMQSQGFIYYGVGRGQPV